MTDLLAANPLLLLFVVAALGYPLGRVKVGGFRLGVASVLFVGLGVGALDPRLQLPSIFYLFGLVLFVYTVGLASGPSFFAAFRRQGLRDNAFVLAVLILAGGVAAAARTLFALPATYTAGMFAGSLTNTPALASILELLGDQGEAVQAESVVAYALTYPVGVVGVIVAIGLAQRFFGVDYAEEADALRDLGASGEHLLNATVRVTRPDVSELSVEGWRERDGWQVILGRLKRGSEISLVYPHSVLHVGDEVGLIGGEEAVERALRSLGERAEEHLEFDRSALDFRRIFVSRPSVAGKTLAALRLPERFGALVTRIRRGDVELLPTGETRLELGDRVRVVARREQIGVVTAFFGDSYRALSEVNITALSLGLVLGLLVGLIPVPLPGGVRFQLGLAGGPLLVALVLGTLGRTGKVVWQLPYSANLTLRQLGLVLFLAGVGTRSGYAFWGTLSRGEGLDLLLVGAFLTLSTALLTLALGHFLFRIPMSLLTGMLAGLQTQPAVLAFAGEQTGNDLPSIGYATVFPLATVAKILIAQLLLTL